MEEIEQEKDECTAVTGVRSVLDQAERGGAVGSVVRLLVKEILVSDDRSSSGTPFPFQPDRPAVITRHQSADTPAHP
jgi:hypothetical protein